MSRPPTVTRHALSLYHRVQLALVCSLHPALRLLFFFFNDTATTEIYTLSLHDALPISARAPAAESASRKSPTSSRTQRMLHRFPRSEEHTSELQSLAYLVCRLLLEKKKTKRA